MLPPPLPLPQPAMMPRLATARIINADSPLKRRRKKKQPIKTAIDTPPIRPSGSRSVVAVVVAVEIVNVVVAALPEGVTVAGEKLHDAPAGSPEQAKETAAENPFCGATETVAAPLCPAVTVKDDGAIETPKSGDGRLMV